MGRKKLFGLPIACLLPAIGLAGTLTFTAAPPTIAAGATGTADLFWGIGKVGGMSFGNNPLASATITSLDTPATKAAKLLASVPAPLVQKYTMFILGSFPNEIQFGGIRAGTDGIVFRGAGTGEPNDNFRVQGDDATFAFINWVGPFALKDSHGMDTQFTVGAVDDFGGLTVTLPASAFVSISDGSFIADKFYDILFTPLSSVGIGLVRNGAELDFTFADGFARNGAGIDFGVTSGTGVITAGITTATVPEPSAIALLGLGFGSLIFLRRPVNQVSTRRPHAGIRIDARNIKGRVQNIRC